MRPCVIRHEAVVLAKPALNGKQHRVIPSVCPIVRLVYRPVERSIHRVEQIKIPALIRIGDRRTCRTPAGAGDVNRRIGVDGGPHVQGSVPWTSETHFEDAEQLGLQLADQALSEGAAELIKTLDEVQFQGHQNA